MNLKTISRVLACVVVVTTLYASPADAATTRVVDSDGAGSATDCSAPAAAYTTISAALLAAGNNDTIIVCPGSGPYNEQLTIAKRVTIRGVLGATLKPSPMVANSTSLQTGGAIAAAILIIDDGPSQNINVINVKIDSLIVDGADNGLSGCVTSPIGVYFRNTSGSVLNSVVRNFRIAGDAGCQGGLGIFAQTTCDLCDDPEPVEPPAEIVSVTVTNTSVHDFQKNGITGNGDLTTLTATGNHVTGDGPTPAIAQNGIQVGFGAKGTIKNNSVYDVVYTLCVDVETCGASSTGILVIGAAGVSVVMQNTVANTQTGIYFESDNGTVSSNAISRSLVWDGIYLPGSDNTVSSNSIVDSDESGIWVDGTGNSVTKNKINEAPIGIHAECGNTVPVIGSDKNTFYNVALEIEDLCALTFTASALSVTASSGAKPTPSVSPVQ